MQRIIIASLLLLQVSAWGALGHMLTARIAEIRLNQSPAYKNINQSVNQLNDLTDGRSNSFIEAACWADDIRSKGTQFW